MVYFLGHMWFIIALLAKIFNGCNVMISSKLVRNYASALFDNAVSDGLKDKVLEQIVTISQIINDNTKIKNILFSPIVKDIDKLKIIESVEKNLNIDAIVKRFLAILLKHSRMSLLSNIVVLYQELLNKSRNIKMVKIISSKTLNLNEKEWVQKYLENDLQQKVIINFSQDPSIVGGIVIQYDSIEKDYSVAGMLTTVKQTLKNTKIDLSYI
jgi:F-type H+-transporting ATPase subunit delta